MKVQDLAKKLGKNPNTILNIVLRKDKSITSEDAVITAEHEEFVKQELNKKKKQPALVYRPQNSTQQTRSNNQKGGNQQKASVPKSSGHKTLLCRKEP